MTEVFSTTTLSCDMVGLLKESVHATLLSLFSVAYKSRCSLPLLISVGFMLLDLHMRLELEIEARVQPEVVQDSEEEQQD